MDHLLDNPVWNALVTGNKNLAEGNEQVKCFPKEIAPFTGLPQTDQNSFSLLSAFIPAGRTIAIVAKEQMEIPADWKTINLLNVFQMLNETGSTQDVDLSDVLPLNTQHVPQMLALTKLTNPGPFFNRTIEFGNYYGIFRDNKLVAITGQRMHPGHYLEVSAVCTQPGYNGNGYAGKLMKHVSNLIRQQSCIPFLHVLTENTGAIKLYNALGFVTRRQMIVHVIQKKTE
jgi:ribosomal protein S18 acetylase RimI-like enzyme